MGGFCKGRDWSETMTKSGVAKLGGCAMLAALNLCLLNARPSKNVPRCLILTVCGTLLLM